MVHVENAVHGTAYQGSPKRVGDVGHRKEVIRYGLVVGLYESKNNC